MARKKTEGEPRTNLLLSLSVEDKKFLKIYAGDLDKLCVHMTYIQLSLIGAKAEVSHQDSIAGNVFETLITPMCFIQ
jgi:hypothetical protein